MLRLSREDDNTDLVLHIKPTAIEYLNHDAAYANYHYLGIYFDIYPCNDGMYQMN